jgi:hypothetical protein
VVNVVTTGCCQKQLPESYSFQQSWTKTQIFARVGDTSTEPHHRFELVCCRGETLSESWKALESRKDMLITILLGAAKAWQKYTATSHLCKKRFLARTDENQATRLCCTLCILVIALQLVIWHGNAYMTALPTIYTFLSSTFTRKLHFSSLRSHMLRNTTASIC